MFETLQFFSRFFSCNCIEVECGLTRVIWSCRASATKIALKIATKIASKIASVNGHWLFEHSFHNLFGALQTVFIFTALSRDLQKIHSSVRGAEKGESTDMLNLLAFCIWWRFDGCFKKTKVLWFSWQLYLTQHFSFLVLPSPVKCTSIICVSFYYWMNLTMFNCILRLFWNPFCISGE